ncbi:MAG: 1-acyl-sn-glycerol-3-phosphate acyltransferase [Pyrinomonadaceae bacterium]|nr:1-acyl-sn-glycerol-3-phosphate acyltransferase [Pyrinomonadaceae bacterium]MCX7639247.1 1-acyl-sn-glycerol-3-phosphate acyltransferase [Pyrinomonadaceae bacterium]MDW8303531.1 lysophospholipid acyltransferase family protein [Acidobacteriota bacterium]
MFEVSFAEKIEKNEKIEFPVKKSSKFSFSGKLRYYWCWFVAAVMVLFIGAPTLVFLWLINRRTWLYPLAQWGAKIWLRACGAKVEVRGIENLESRKSYIFVSNHRSYLDTAALFAYTGRRMSIVAKKELLKVPIFGQGMGFVNIIAIDRSNPEKAIESINRTQELLSKGYSVGFFAEGTRAMPGELLPFKKGAFHLALQTGTPIVPVAIKNTDWMMGKNCGTAFPGTIQMIFLPPVEVEGYRTEDIPKLLNKVRGMIAEELAKV